jgi:hypothetical protein
MKQASGGWALTSHARQRLAERTQMTEQDLLHIFNTGVETTPVSNEGKKVHRLFYSVDDDQCFVAVVDEKVKEVVTIRTPEQSLHGVVTFEAVEHLRCLLRPRVVSMKAVSPSCPSIASVFRLEVSFWENGSGHVRRKTFTVPTADFPQARQDLLALETCDGIQKIVEDFIKTHRRANEMSDNVVTVKVGKKGGPVVLRFPNMLVL